MFHFYLPLYEVQVPCDFRIVPTFYFYFRCLDLGKSEGNRAKNNEG